MIPKGFHGVRQKLDDLGYFQPLVPEAIPLVEALLYDLLNAKHDLKACQDRERRHTDISAPRSRHEEKVSKPLESAKEELKREKFEKLEKKVFDLQLLNSQATSMINRLQQETLEKSKIIHKLESKQKATVVTKTTDLLKPKIEMTSLVKPTSSKASSNGHHSESDLNLIAMYDNRNRLMDEKLVQMQGKLEEAQKMLSNLEAQLSEKSRMLASESTNECETSSKEGKSEYLLNLIKENERLKDEMASIEQHTRICFHGQKVFTPLPHPASSHHPSSHHHHHHHHQMTHARSCEDIRQAVHESHHLMMHNKCLQNQVGHLQSQTDLRNQHQTKNLQSQQEYISEIQSKMTKLSEENGELKRRVQDLKEIRKTQREKIEELSKQQMILLKDGSQDHQKVAELINYIEKQRDVYKNSVEKLLDKLDPDRQRKLEETLARDESYLGETRSHSPDLRVLRNIQNNSRIVIRSNKRNSDSSSNHASYRPSPYRASLSPDKVGRESQKQVQEIQEQIQILEGQVKKTKLEKLDLEKRFRIENKELQESKERLRDQVSYWKMKFEENETRLKEVIERAEDVPDSNSLLQLHDRLRAQQTAIGELEAQLTTKQQHLKRLSDDKDDLQNELDNKAIELAEAKRQLSEMSSTIARVDADKTVEDQRLKQCLQEVQRLNEQLRSSEEQADNLRRRQAAEKSVNGERRQEIEQLKTQLQTSTKEKSELETQVQDLRSHIQSYVTEVKRIEELLSVREKERSELLQQYKHLSVEIDSAESYGRKMSAKVESLQMDLDDRTTQLEASQRRLIDMEKDLVEMSLSNETYRSQVAELNTKLDVTNSQLKEMKSHSTWVNSENTNIHEIAVQLNTQKLELQNQIAEQASEIEQLNSAIRSLRSEVLELSEQVRREREKSQTLEDKIKSGNSHQRYGER